MNVIISKITHFIRKETVLSAAFVLAVISSFIITPDRDYISYIDWNTLLLLFSLMAVIAGFQKLGIFKNIGNKLLSKTQNTRQLLMVLIFLPFFFSMLITNDVALITFVPFAITVLRLSKQEKLLVPIVVMQTIAANLGSMLTPMGNPQNLYLYAKSEMSLWKFIQLMLPYTIEAFLCLLFVILFFTKNNALSQTSCIVKDDDSHKTKTSFTFICFCLFFLICLLCVSKLIKPVFPAIIILLYLLITDHCLLKEIDYSLLGTFICFFIFIGNMGRIDYFCKLLENILTGNELIVSVISSQIISNVPTALLLSGFSSKWDLLIVGTNLGGLGTLIASMASLISYKQIVKEYPKEKGRYFKSFTLANIVMLAILLVTAYLISQAATH